MASPLPLWKACGPVALPLLLLSVALFTVGFDRVAFWWRWWRQGRRPWRALGTTAGLMAVLRQLGPQLLLPPAAPLAAYGEVLLPTLLGLQLTLVAMALQLLNQGLRRWQLRRCARTQLPLHDQPRHDQPSHQP